MAKKKKAAKKVGRSVKRGSKKATAGGKPSAKEVKIELTAEQRAELEKLTKGKFTSATFVFGKGKKIVPPVHKVTCMLARIPV